MVLIKDYYIQYFRLYLLLIYHYTSSTPGYGNKMSLKINILKNFPLFTNNFDNIIIHIHIIISHWRYFIYSNYIAQQIPSNLPIFLVTQQNFSPVPRKSTDKAHVLHSRRRISRSITNFLIRIEVTILIIFPPTCDRKMQWSTSGIENVADFCHFVT